MGDGAATIAYVTSTGDVETATIRRSIVSVVLTAGSDAATLVLRFGGSGGTIFCKLAAATGTSATALLFGASVGGGIHATLTGTSPAAMIVYE